MISTAFAAVATLVVFLIGRAMGVPGSGALLPAQAIYVALHTALLAAGLLLYAQMTAPVLATNIPAFPKRAWIAMHLTLGLVAGFLSGLAMLGADDVEPVDWSDGTEVALLLAVLFGAGAIAGAGIGGLQALVLRHAAKGLGFWIVCWILAAGLAVPFGGLAETLIPGARSLQHELVAAGMTMVIGLIGALAMLPAVRRLRPKV